MATAEHARVHQTRGGARFLHFVNSRPQRYPALVGQRPSTTSSTRLPRSTLRTTGTRIFGQLEKRLGARPLPTNPRRDLGISPEARPRKIAH